MYKTVKYTKQELKIYGLRMLHLIRVMNEVIENDWAFSLEILHMKVNTFLDQKLVLASGKPENSCGTVACMIGWAAADPWHKNRGLRWDGENEIVYNNGNGVILYTILNTIMKYLKISFAAASDTFFVPKDGRIITAKQARRKLIALAKRKGVDVSVIPPLPESMKRKAKIVETVNF